MISIQLRNAAIASVAIIALALGIWILTRTAKPTESESSKTPQASRTENLPKAPAKSKNDRNKSDTEARFIRNMTGLEYAHLRVALPRPIDAPWEAAYFDSHLALGEWKKTAVEVLPDWIRDAVLARNSEMAGRYLWTLIKLTEDNDRKISSQSVFALYRLGDYDGVAIGHIKQWMDNNVAFGDFVSNGVNTVYQDIRAIALDEIDYYGSVDLLETIYKVWAKTETDGGKHSGEVDYGYYLETHGKTLPAEYWLQRLQSRSDFQNTLEVLEQKRPPDLVERLQMRFQELYRSKTPPVDADVSALLASSLFRLTAEPQHRDYLVTCADQQLGEDGLEASLESILRGLATTNDMEAIAVVGKALEHRNSVVREMAIAALGYSQRTEATAMLYDNAVKQARNEKILPERQLMALLAQRIPAADAKYEEFKAAALARQLGFFIDSSEFAALNFFKKYGRRNRKMK